MAKSDLLKQAIADAKTVKETALANAKIALQEAFTPRIKEMLANKLTTEIEGEEDVEIDANINAEAPAGEKMGANNMDVRPTNVKVGLDFDDDGDWDIEGILGAEEEETPESDEEMTAEYNEGMDMDNPDDLNLESIIRELEEDLEDPLMGHDTAETSELGEDYMYERDEEELMSTNLEEDTYEIDDIIESILRETEEMEDADDMNPTDLLDNEKDSMIDEMADELEIKDQQLDEAYQTVKRLQSVINEVNLLNAKLLYTNKLFRNFQLSETQKIKVIENFDRAGNTRETKLVYTTLAESFKQTKTKKRIVKESYSAASRPVATTAPNVTNTQVLSEGFELANRWKKLAGIL